MSAAPTPQTETRFTPGWVPPWRPELDFVNGRPLASSHLERDLVRLIEKARTPEEG